MPLPSGVKVEIEFVAGTFVDVTADLDNNGGYTITVGRTSPQQLAQVSALSLTLRNPTGKYTPLVPILSDGTTAPFYPNVVPRKRVRVSNSSGVRFLGYIKSWSPMLANGITGMCAITASDRMDQFARIILAAAIRQEVLDNAAAYYWPLTDAAGSMAAAESSGNNGPSLIVVNTADAALTFGDTGPGAGEGTGVKLSPSASSAGQYLATRLPTPMPLAGGFTVAIDVNLGGVQPAWGTGAGTQTVAGFDDGLNNISGAIFINGSGAACLQTATATQTGANILDSSWHCLVATFSAPGGTQAFYVDGVSAGSGLAPPATSLNVVTLGEETTPIAYVLSRFKGHVGQYAIIPGAMSAANVATLSGSVDGFAGETIDARIKRLLGYGGLTSADWTIDASTVVVGSYPQDGKDILTACQDMAVTEGGGAAFYVLNGSTRFASRRYRKPGAPVLTVSAVGDIDGGTYTPSLDDANLVNQATVNRATESGTASTQIASNAASVATYGLSTADVTSYASSDRDALSLAESLVARGKVPGWRLPRVTVDLLTAETNLYATVQLVQIGSRLRVTALPAGQAPASQVDVIVEGWTESANVSTYSISYDTSPADVPSGMINGDSTYGRAQALPDCALNAALTNVATTVVIKTPTAPHFTTTAARYPLNIKIDGEVIKLNTAPGAGTPQTFTGCTRAQNGTTAAAHASGATVRLDPPSAAAL